MNVIFLPFHQHAPSGLRIPTGKNEHFRRLSAILVPGVDELLRAGWHQVKQLCSHRAKVDIRFPMFGPVHALHEKQSEIVALAGVLGEPPPNPVKLHVIPPADWESPKKSGRDRSGNRDPVEFVQAVVLDLVSHVDLRCSRFCSWCFHASTSSSSESSSKASASAGAWSCTGSGSWEAAARTSSLPVTTSAVRRVRYSRSSEISRS